MIRFKKILYEDPSSDAKKLGLWHIGYGRYVALGKNQQAKLVAVSRKGVLKFVGKDKELWLNKLNQLNEQTQKIDIFKFDDFKFIEKSKIIIEEVKGYIKENDLIKAKFACKYCKKNNIEYRFLLGKEFKMIENLSYVKS